MKHRIIIAVLIIWGLVLSSCAKFLEDYSQDLATVSGWQDLDELLLGDAYLKPSYVQSDFIFDDIKNPNFEFLHFMGDELEQNPANKNSIPLNFFFEEPNGFGCYTWQQDIGRDDRGTQVAGGERPWNMLYAYINAANIILAQIDAQPAATATDQQAKERIKGEAYFLRAAYYFLLVNLYAEPYRPDAAAKTKGVPFKLTEYIEDKAFERSSLAEVYGQILADLEQAINLLEGKPQSTVHRTNATAAYLLKSRVCLYMQDYPSAAQYAQKVLDRNSDLVNLAKVAAGQNVFSGTSKEVLFSMGGYLVAAYSYPQENQDPVFSISKDLDQLYTDNDYRLGTYIKRLPSGLTAFTKIRLQKGSWQRPAEVSDCFMLRTSEAYLNLAEASAMLGDEARAKTVLTRFLTTRMKKPSELTFGGKDLIDFIRQERAREFCIEGHRWFDLRRYLVSKERPWSKEIEHDYTEFNYISETGQIVPTRTRYYKLAANDKAYTLEIPQKVVQFQPSLAESFRPDRPPFKVVTY